MTQRAGKKKKETNCAFSPVQSGNGEEKYKRPVNPWLDRPAPLYLMRVKSRDIGWNPASKEI